MNAASCDIKSCHNQVTLQFEKSHGVSWVQGVTEKFGLKVKSEQLQRWGWPHFLRQTVPNSRCGRSNGMVTDVGTLAVTVMNIVVISAIIVTLLCSCLLLSS